MNPAEYFQTLPTELLRAIALGEVDAQALAGEQLASRGLDQRGRWVGFERAARVWGQGAEVSRS